MGRVALILALVLSLLCGFAAGEQQQQQHRARTSARDVILGYAVGYNLKDYAYFIDSAMACTHATLVLWVNHPHDAHVYRYGGRLRIELPRFGAGSPVIRRFYEYAAWVESPPFAVGRILLTDVRDAFFQGDVFAPMLTPGVHLFAEGLVIRDEPTNQGWILDCPLDGGAEALQRVLDQPIRNGGIVGASGAGAMLFFLREMIRGLDAGCNDQGWLNLLAMMDNLTTTVHTLTRGGDSWVAHGLIDWSHPSAARLVREPWRASVLIDAAGRLVNPQGTRVYALIHQDGWAAVHDLRKIQRNWTDPAEPVPPLRPFHRFEF